MANALIQLRAFNICRMCVCVCLSVKHALQFNWNPIDNILAYYVIVFDYSHSRIGSEEHLPFEHASSFPIESLKPADMCACKRSVRVSAFTVVVIILWDFCAVPCCAVFIAGSLRESFDWRLDCMRLPNRNRKVISAHNVCFMYADCSQHTSFQWKSSDRMFVLRDEFSIDRFWFSIFRVFFFCSPVFTSQHIHYPAVSVVLVSVCVCVCNNSGSHRISFFSSTVLIHLIRWCAYCAVCKIEVSLKNAYVRENINDDKRRAANQIQTLLFTLLYISTAHFKRRAKFYWMGYWKTSQMRIQFFFGPFSRLRNIGAQQENRINQATKRNSTDYWILNIYKKIERERADFAYAFKPNRKNHSNKRAREIEPQSQYTKNNRQRQNK